MAEYGGNLDLLQVTDFIRNLFKERAAKRGLRDNPQLVGQEGPATGPVDPALFSNPYFVQALQQRSGMETAEAARGLTRAQTSGLQQEMIQQQKDAERLGGVSTPAFGAMTTRESVRSEIPFRERAATVAETNAQTDKDRLALLKEQMGNEATVKFVENIMPLASLLGGKDIGGFASALLSSITSGPFAAAGKVAGERSKAKQDLLKDVLGARGTTTPGTAAPPAPGNVFQNPSFKGATERYREAGKTPAGYIQQFGGPGAIPSAPTYNYPPQITSPQQVTGAASNLMTQIQGLLQKRGELPTTPEAEKTFSREQGRLPQLTSDYQTFVEAARALGVKDLDQLNQFIAQLEAAGHLKAR